MLSLSQTSGYAILALSCLDDSPGGWMLAKDIAARTGVPRPYLSKILHALGKAKLIRTKRGYRGGFVLARPAREIPILDVARAVEGEDYLGKCLLGLEICADERACPTHEFWKVERARIQACLAKLSLRDVAKFERGRPVAYAYGPRPAPPTPPPQERRPAQKARPAAGHAPIRRQTRKKKRVR